MIKEELRAVKSGKRQLRMFGLTVGGAFGLLGALSLWRGSAPYPYLFALSGILIGLGLICPMVLKRVHRVWMAFALVLGWVMTRVILSVLFYAGVTPISIIARLVGKRFLELEMDSSKETYWVYRDSAEGDRQKWERQY
jgi:hypothetical protein